MEKLTIDQLIKSVPYYVRFEILKKQLRDIYDLEHKHLANIKRLSGDYYHRQIEFERNYLRRKYNIKRSHDDDIEYRIKIFLKTIEKAELPDDMLTDLYKWAKKERIQLGLKDNLFNLFDNYIYEPSLPHEYDKLTKKIYQKTKKLGN